MTDPAQTRPAAAKPAGNVDEFAHIPRRRARHPIITLAGALLAFFLVFYGRRDLRYALSSGEPVELGSAAALFAAGGAKAIGDLENRYVRVAGVPDRESALELDTKGSWVFSQLFRVMGTGNRLFVHRLENPLPAARAEADVFEGRLIRIDELPYAAAIRGYFARHVTATHYFAADAMLKALAGRSPNAPVSVADRGGDPVTIGADEPMAIDVRRPDEIQIGLPQARLPTEEAARGAITSRGGEVVAAKGLVKAAPLAGAGSSSLLSSAPEPPSRWTFVVRFPPARRQASLDELGDIDRLVEIREARETITTRASELSAESAALVIRAPGAPERRLPAAEIAAVHTVAPVVIPDDAYLVIEGDRPREHVASIIIALVLMVFGVFNVVALVRNR